MTLARALPDAGITAVEIHAPFVETLSGRLRVAELETGAGPDLGGLLAEIRQEIDVVRRFRDEAGYTFFVLRRVDG